MGDLQAKMRKEVRRLRLKKWETELLSNNFFFTPIEDKIEGKQRRTCEIEEEKEKEKEAESELSTFKKEASPVFLGLLEPQFDIEHFMKRDAEYFSEFRTRIGKIEDEENHRKRNQLLQLKELEKVHDSKNLDIKQLEETVADLKAELETKADEINKLRTREKEVEKLLKEIDSKNRDIKELEGTVDDLRTKKEEFHQVQKLQEKEVEKLRKVIGSKNQDIKQLEGTVGKQEKEVEELRKVIGSKNQDIKQLEGTIGNLETKLEIKEDEINASMDNLITAEDRLKLTEKVIEQLQYQILEVIDAKNQDILQLLGTTNTWMENLIDAKNQDILQFKETVDDLETGLEIKEDEINILMEKLTTAEVKKNRYRKEVEMLARDNNALQELNGLLSKVITICRMKMA